MQLTWTRPFSRIRQGQLELVACWFTYVDATCNGSWATLIKLSASFIPSNWITQDGDLWRRRREQCAVQHSRKWWINHPSNSQMNTLSIDYSSENGQRVKSSNLNSKLQSPAHQPNQRDCATSIEQEEAKEKNSIKVIVRNYHEHKIINLKHVIMLINGIWYKRLRDVEELLFGKEDSWKGSGNSCFNAPQSWNLPWESFAACFLCVE